MVEVWKALADPTRRALLDELQDRDEQTLFELCARLATKHGLTPTRQAVGQHLDVLGGAGLVRRRREGRCTFHSYDPAPLRQAVRRWRLDDPEEDRHEDRTDERAGRRPGQGAGVLHRRARLREEDRGPDG